MEIIRSPTAMHFSKGNLYNSPMKSANEDRRTTSIFQLTPLWEHVVRMRNMPSDIDMDELFHEFRERLRDPEWEVRQHSLRVLADMIPVMHLSLDVRLSPLIDFIIANLGHTAPAVRKSSLDVLKVYILHTSDIEQLFKKILDNCDYKFSYFNDIENNVITGIILSLPTLVASALYKYSEPSQLISSVFRTLGNKLFTTTHQDIALRSFNKFEELLGTSDFNIYLSYQTLEVQNKYKFLSDIQKIIQSQLVNTFENTDFKNNSMFSPQKSPYGESNYKSGLLMSFPSEHHDVINMLKEIDTKLEDTKLALSDNFLTLSDESNSMEMVKKIIKGKVVLETEIKFDSETAITMTILEESERRNINRPDSEDDCCECSTDDTSLIKAYTDSDLEDKKANGLVEKRVRFGGEEIKMRTPDSDITNGSEGENRRLSPSGELADEEKSDHESEIADNSNPASIVKKVKPLKSLVPVSVNSETTAPKYVSGIQRSLHRKKSKSLSDLYEYFRSKNSPLEMEPSIMDDVNKGKPKKCSSELNFISEHDNLTTDTSHGEVEVLHNLQRSPCISPKRTKSKLTDLHVGTSSSSTLLATKNTTAAKKKESPNAQWEKLNFLRAGIMEDLHVMKDITDTQRGLEHLNEFILDPDNLESLEKHMGELLKHVLKLCRDKRLARICHDILHNLVANMSIAVLREHLRTLALASSTGPDMINKTVVKAILKRVSLQEVVKTILPNSEKTKIPIVPNTTMSLPDQPSSEALVALSKVAGARSVLQAVQELTQKRRDVSPFYRVLQSKLQARAEEETVSKSVKYPNNSHSPRKVEARDRSTSSHRTLPPIKQAKTTVLAARNSKDSQEDRKQLPGREGEEVRGVDHSHTRSKGSSAPASHQHQHAECSAHTHTHLPVIVSSMVGGKGKNGETRTRPSPMTSIFTE